MARLRDDLEREWEALVAQPASTAALRRWTAADGRLAGFDSLDQLITLVRRPPTPRAGNDVLAALLRVGDDALARRCLLEALMPSLVRLAGRYPSAGETADDRLQSVLVHAIERIHELAGEDVSWPAVTIGGYVRDRLRRARRPRPDAVVVPVEAALGVHAGPERSAAERLTGLLVDGLRRGSIRRSDAALIYTTRVAGHRSAAVAATMGVDPVVLRTRRRRAEQRLGHDALSVC